MEDVKNLFEREHLQMIREQARGMAEFKGLSPAWARAYLRLADAADHLDAMMDRSTVKNYIQEAP